MHHELRALFLRLLPMAAAVPGLHCASTVTGDLPDASADVAPDAPAPDAPAPDAPAPDAPPRDVTPPPPDVDVCAPRAQRGDPCAGPLQPRVFYPCGLPAGIGPGPVMNTAFCERVCADAFPSSWCYAYPASDSTQAFIQCSACAEGRRPEGFELPALRGDPMQVFLSAAAALEAAAIGALDRLARELTAHGAPAQLAERALAAKDDERRHTRAMVSLARSRGADPELPRVGDMPVRALDAVALENAVEGCVRETWGAMLAWWQAAHARDADVAGAFTAIADDETAHAALAWDVAAWADAALDEEGRGRVRDARDRAVDALRAQMEAAWPDALVAPAGLPPRDVALRLWSSLRDALWS